MIQHTTNKNRRAWPRESVQIPAMYFIEGYSAEFQLCTITSISRSGAAVLLPWFAIFQENATCRLDIIMPRAARLLSVRGHVKIKHRQPCVMAAGIQFGVQFQEFLPESVITALQYSRPLQGWHSVLQKRIEYGPSAFGIPG